MRRLRRTLRSKLPRAFMHKLIGSAIKWGLRLIYATCRFSIEDPIKFKELSQKGGFILTMWHSRIAMVEPFLKRAASMQGTYTIVVSHAIDADLVVRATESYPQAKVVRVPPRNRHVALRKMIQAINDEEVLIVVADGSRGPALKAQPGIPFTARAACTKIIPVSFHPSRCWTLNSWDKMMIPKPFSKISCVIGEPLTLPPKSDNDSLDDAERLTAALASVDESALAGAGA